MLRSLVTFCLWAIPALAASATDWGSRSIYQIVTDRFATSDGSSPACDTSQRKYCGGTWKGIASKLDYIQNMGFDAIWISPIVANIEGTTGKGEAYHGYWTVDQNALNSHFGTPDDLKALSSALHERDMYLMLDVVVNHMAADTVPPKYSLFTPFGEEGDFHRFCWITEETNQTNVEQCWLGDEAVPLADMDTESDPVINFFYSWIQDLVSEYDADGLRIDTVRNIRIDFWPDFASAAGVFTLGEVYDGSVAYVSPYTHALDSVLDYPVYYALTQGFNSTEGSLAVLSETVQESQDAYAYGEFRTGSFLENQDNPRFPSLTSDEALIKNAMAWPFIHDGIPILYYGQEQGFSGGNNPDNVEALWTSHYDTNASLVMYVKTLNAARKAAIAGNSTFLKKATLFMSTTPSSLVISKPPMMTLLTNGGSSSTPSWTVPDAGYTEGEELIDVISCNTTKANARGGVSVQGAGGMPQVLLPTSIFNQSYCQELKKPVNINENGNKTSSSGGSGSSGSSGGSSHPASGHKSGASRIALSALHLVSVVCFGLVAPSAIAFL